MAVTRYAVISIGSYEIELKVYEITNDKKIRVVDNIKSQCGLGNETYTRGRLSFEIIDKLCEELEKFNQIVKEYKVNDFDAVATSAIREADNVSVVLDRIKVRTGISVRILSNSEERLIDYEALSLYENESKEFIDDGTACVDMGSGSVQISLIEKGVLVGTQNLRLGSIRISELLYNMSEDMQHFNMLVDELINNDWQTYKKMMIKDKEITSIIATGLQMSRFIIRVHGGKPNVVYDAGEFKELCDSLLSKNIMQISKVYGITEEQAVILLTTIKIYYKIMAETNAKRIWIPCTTLTDGMVIDYCLRKKKISIKHNYNDDIISTAKVISKRYKANQTHINNIREIATNIFDTTKKVHGLKDRDRLILEIAVILHDCGKYISINAAPQCSYDIIMATEILGLSHSERKKVADIVMYNTVELENVDDMTIIKLVAILRLANSLDRSHRQKFQNYKLELKESQLIITIKTDEDITLEKLSFEEKADFFEEVFGVKPLLKKKRGI